MWILGSELLADEGAVSGLLGIAVGGFVEGTKPVGKGSFYSFGSRVARTVVGSSDVNLLPTSYLILEGVAPVWQL
jgi:hypothetical protein